MAAAIGMIAGCQKPEMVQISAPEDVVAPVLSPVADINITAANLGLESPLPQGLCRVGSDPCVILAISFVIPAISFVILA